MENMKYKAWNKKEGRWATIEEHLNKVLPFPKKALPVTVMEFDLKNFDVKFYTGFNDSDHKEIFSGDIIETNIDNEKVRHEVNQNNDGCWMAKSWYGSIYLESIFDHSKIVGNSIEHPSLLDEEEDE